ncbi:MAG: hypothetical protein HW403_1026 [Dehalococcoidia bacterium]|nr:hypothetical protein [Dehalococcoidia bacterium]
MDVLLYVIVGLVAFLAFVRPFRIAQEYERLVLFQLGRCVGERGPGVVLVIPIIHRVVRVDLREQVVEIPHQTCITKDNAPISIDFLIYSRVVSSQDSVIAVGNYTAASQGIATTTLRAVIGDIPLDDVLSKREQINHVLQGKMDEVTERWGVKVTTVEIREIQPPREVQEAMNRQMTAERVRRATVTEAEGQKQATVTVAEGDKQSAILRAEGERQAAILRAEGFSLALEKIFGVASTVDDRTMQLQYFDTLKALGASPATKFIFPLEFTNFMAGIARRDGGGAAPQSS